MTALGLFFTRLLRAVTCMSCGAEYGQPHTANCEFQSVTR